MTPGPETIVEETPLDEIVTVMEQKRIKRLPVMRGDKMVGIVSRANLVQALATLARETADTLPSDTALGSSCWRKLTSSLGRRVT